MDSVCVYKVVTHFLALVRKQKTQKQGAILFKLHTPTVEDFGKVSCEGGGGEVSLKRSGLFIELP